MDLPLSIVLFHILAIKIRSDHAVVVCLFICLFLQLHITSPSMLVFHAPIDVDVAISVSSPPFPKQDADVGIFLCLNCSYPPDADVYQLLFAAIGFLPPKCKMWRLRIIVGLFVCLTKMQDVDVAMMRAVRVLWQEFQPLTSLTWNG